MLRVVYEKENKDFSKMRVLVTFVDDLALKQISVAQLTVEFGPH
jgi:hypothetical protein